MRCKSCAIQAAFARWIQIGLRGDGRSVVRNAGREAGEAWEGSADEESGERHAGLAVAALAADALLIQIDTVSARFGDVGVVRIDADVGIVTRGDFPFRCRRLQN